MHVLDLRMIDIHCRELLKIDLEHDGGDGSALTHFIPQRPSKERMTAVLQLFQGHRDHPDLMENLLKSKWSNFAALWHICNDRGLRIAGNAKNRAWFIYRIQFWMQGVTDEELMQIPDKPPVVDTVLSNVPLTTTEHMNELEIESCQLLLNALRRGTKFSSLLAYNKKTYEYLCKVRDLPEDGSKAELYDRLLESVIKEKEDLGLLATDSANGGAVLGRDVMKAIWADMHKTILPSWVGAAPKNWGTAKRGKLSADHWRTIFTIHLPITLIWLWREETGRKQELMDNIVHLVLAILTANFKTASAKQADTYDLHITHYMPFSISHWR
ncbi:hypothetical protein C8J57DRAFT_1501920 [Mycena rebaudengoi]|nr:hypothetical protein C8J57DRAFT_1501920 [Mycena rebaudengoi]